MSLVTSLSRLNIVGEFKPPKPLEQTDPLGVELHKLKTSKRMQFSNNNLKEKIGMTVGYHNIRSFQKYCNHIDADAWYSRCDILVLAETQSLPGDQLQLNGFVLFYRSDNTQFRKQRGLALFCKTLEKPQVLKHVVVQNEPNKTSFNLDLILIKTFSKYIITGYKSPATPNFILQSNVIDLIKIAIADSNDPNCEMAFLGDFNIDVIESDILQKILGPFGFDSKLPVKESTTNNETQIDVVFTNFSGVIAGIYETYFSDHKPIFLMIKDLGFDLDFKDVDFSTMTQNAKRPRHESPTHDELPLPKKAIVE